MTDLAASDLAAIYPKPSPRVIAKARPQIDAHARNFIAMSPFCVLATSGSDGQVDASPRGGHPGFVSVAGPILMLLIYDRRMFRRMFPDFGLTPEDSAAVIRHLVTFTLAGLSAVARDAQIEPPTQ